MKIRLKLLFLFLFSFACMQAKNGLPVRIWYDAPADEWMKSLPLGNGRLGMMAYGGVETETLALNESSMWAGGYDSNQVKEFVRHSSSNR